MHPDRVELRPPTRAAGPALLASPGPVRQNRGAAHDRTDRECRPLPRLPRYRTVPLSTESRRPPNSNPRLGGAWTWVWVVSILLLVAGCERQPRLAAIAPDETVLAFGDSLTFGTGATEAESYPARLAARIGRRVIGAGVPGETTAGGRERLPALLEEHRPRLVLLCLGGNDFLRRVDEAQIRANLRAMLELARERGSAVLLIGVPRAFVGDEAAPLYRELAREFGVPLQNSAIARVLRDRKLKSDPIHPNAAGYARIAEMVEDALREAGAL